MSVSVGSMSAGLGLDMSEFQRGMQAATEVARSNSALMSAEMKRTSREGAEAFRSIDEMIGIHINRPMTRLLVETFPTFGKALATALGGVAFGAVGFAATEVFERVSKGIEEARQAQEKFAESSRHAAETVTSILGGLENKLHEASGDHSLKFSLQGTEEAKRAIEEIAKASDQAAADAEKASGWWERIKLDAGDAFENIARGGASILDALASFRGAAASALSRGSIPPSTTGSGGIKDKLFDPQELANMKDALKDMRVDLEIALNTDAAKGTHQSLVLLANDIKAATAYLKDMEKAGDESGKALARSSLEFFSNAQKAAQISQQIAGADAAKAADEEHKKDIHDLQEQLKGYNDEANKGWQTWIKTNEELEKASAKIGEMSALEDAAARFREFQKINGPVDTALPPPGAPALSDQGELSKITSDPSESWKKAGEVLQSIETPLQKYDAGLAVLQELESQGRLTTDQFAAAQQKLQEQLAESSNKLEELLKKTGDASAGMQAFFLQLEKNANQNGAFTFELLNKGLDGFESSTARALTGGKGEWRKYFEELDQMALKFVLNKTISQGILSGKNIFDNLRLLTQPTGGSVGDVSNPSLMTPSYMPGGAPTSAAMPDFMKLSKEAFAPLGSLFNQPQQAAQEGQQSLPIPSGLPDFMNLPKEAFSAPSALSGATSGAAQTQFQTAVTTFSTATPIYQTATTMFQTAATTMAPAATLLQTASATLMAAASELMASGTMNLGSDAAKQFAAGPGALFPGIGSNASGTDDWRGGLTWVGEKGPELLNLPGGTSIKPASSMRGGDTHIHNYDLRGADPATVQKLVAALPIVEERAVARAVASSSEIARRTANR